MDPTTMLMATGKPIVERALGHMIKRVDNVDRRVEEDFVILGREMRIECPQAIQKYSISFKTKSSGIHVLPRKKKFNFGTVRRVELRPAMSLQLIPDVINYIDNGFEIKVDKLEKDVIYLLDVEYLIDDMRFINALVNRNVAKETLENDNKEYWLVAQLKHLDVFRQNFGYIQLKDIDFGVDVSVYNDIKMKIPSIFRKQLETAVKLLSRHHGGRDDQFKLLMQHRQLQRARKEKYYGEELFEIIENIQEIFSPYSFNKYIDVKKDFYYHTCEKGKDFYESLPFPTWPKTMKVISRTDLDFEKPAADGLLVYKKKDVLKELEKIFGSD